MKTFKVYFRNNYRLDNAFVDAMDVAGIRLKMMLRYPNATIIQVVAL